MRSACISWLAAGIVAMAGVNAYAESTSEQPVALDIAAQPLGEALNQLSAQSGLQIILHSEVTRGLTSSRLVGQFTPHAALERLLADTGLRYESIGPQAVAVMRLSDRSTDIGMKVPAESEESQRMRMAQTDVTGKEASPQGSSSGETLEEVVVTAQKRKEKLQDVPISMSVLGGRELDKSNSMSVNEVLNVSVPGLATTYSSFPGATQLSVRGVSTPQPINDGSTPIAYYVDSVPFGFVRSAMVPDVGTFDLQQVEVLRGPQGTLYGANAVNGVVRVLTNDADLSKMEFKTRVSTSSTKGGDASYRGDFAVNVPLIEDKFAARLTASYANSGGWIDTLVKHDTNDSQLSDVRLKINARPTDGLSIGLSYWHSKVDLGAFDLGTSNDVYPGIIDSPTTTRFDATGLKVGYELPEFSISSATSYIDYKNHNNFDLTPFAGPPLNIPDWYGQLGYNQFDSRVFSQEFTLTSSAAGECRWTAGAFYRDAEDRTFQRAPYWNPSLSYGDTSKSVAAFGELTRELMGGKVELTGGLRYFRDQVTSSDISTPVRDNETFHHVSPRAVLNWHPSMQMTAYVSYGEGFRSGLSQSAAAKASAPEFGPAKPDTLHNYELGAKGALLDGRISFDSALYYIDWRDVQEVLFKKIAGATVGYDVLVNSKAVSGPGIDLNVTMHPWDSLEFGFNLGWNNLTFDQDVVSDDGAIVFHKGDRMNFSPEYTYGTLAAYSFPFVGNNLRGRFSVSGSYHTKQLVQSDPLPNKGNDLLNVRVALSVAARESWTTELFVDNATNDRGNVMTSPGYDYFDVRTRPRTIGLQFEYWFAK